jgi:ParB-like chromosome segregation protein Spo0J
MQFRDRIQELRRVPARELCPNPRNWRVHSPAQQNALRGVLAEIGYADALLVRERDDGQLEIIDGHLRAEVTPNQLVPVLILNVTAEEAHKILLTHDPLAALATTNETALQSLMQECSFENNAVQKMLQELSGAPLETASGNELPSETREVPIQESYQVVATCETEEVQRELFERLTREGFACRLLML